MKNARLLKRAVEVIAGGDESNDSLACYLIADVLGCDAEPVKAAVDATRAAAAKEAALALLTGKTK